MNRKQFLQSLGLLLTSSVTASPENIFDMFEKENIRHRMPVLFVGHGSPMYAIEENEFVQNWRRLGAQLPKPTAIVVISAHWETRGTQVTAMHQPPTIHDFGGFPRALYEIEYPAPGNPELANEIIQQVKTSEIIADRQWGLDHGTWSVISRVFPEANIPVVQLSLDYNKSPKQHYELAKELADLRKRGVLIVGSGNIVHNLRKVAWDKPDDMEYGYEWATEANSIVKKLIDDHQHESLINYSSLGSAVQLAIPTPDHFLPLLYVLALQQDNDKISYFNDKAVMGSLTMTSLIIG